MLWRPPFVVQREIGCLREPVIFLIGWLVQLANRKSTSIQREIPQECHAEKDIRTPPRGAPQPGEEPGTGAASPPSFLCLFPEGGLRPLPATPASDDDRVDPQVERQDDEPEGDLYPFRQSGRIENGQQIVLDEPARITGLPAPAAEVVFERSQRADPAHELDGGPVDRNRQMDPMSDLTSNLSDLTPDLPDLTPDLSDPIPDLSDLTPDLPDLTPDLSDPILDLSDLTSELSDPTPGLSDLNPDLIHPGRRSQTSPRTWQISPRTCQTSPRTWLILAGGDPTPPRTLPEAVGRLLSTPTEEVDKSFREILAGGT